LRRFGNPTTNDKGFKPISLQLKKAGVLTAWFYDQKL